MTLTYNIHPSGDAGAPYTSFAAAWTAATGDGDQSELVAVGDWDGEAEDGGVVVQDTDTSSDVSDIVLRSDAANRHAGVPDATKASFLGTVSVWEYATLEGLQSSLTGRSIHVRNTGLDLLIDAMVTAGRVEMDHTSGTVFVRNSVGYSLNFYSFGQEGAGSSVCHNVTGYGSTHATYGNFSQYNGTMTLVNCVSAGAVGPAYYGTFSSSEYCFSDDGTEPGTNGGQFTADPFTDTAGFDFSIADDTELGSGADLSTDPTLPVTVDIAGTARTQFTPGAFEFLGSGFPEGTLGVTLEDAVASSAAQVEAQGQTSSNLDDSVATASAESLARGQASGTLENAQANATAQAQNSTASASSTLQDATASSQAIARAAGTASITLTDTLATSQAEALTTGTAGVFLEDTVASSSAEALAVGSSTMLLEDAIVTASATAVSGAFGSVVATLEDAQVNALADAPATGGVTAILDEAIASTLGAADTQGAIGVILEDAVASSQAASIVRAQGSGILEDSSVTALAFVLLRAQVNVVLEDAVASAVASEITQKPKLSWSHTPASRLTHAHSPRPELTWKHQQ